MAGVINAITLGLGGLMSIPLLQDFFPSSQAQTTVVSFTNGALNRTEGPYDGNGPMPNVALFNVNGGRVGFMSGLKQGNLGRAQTRPIKVDPINKSNNEVPEYLSVSASSSNAICISYLAVTGPNQEYWTWNGEFGKLCKQWFYYSNQPMSGTSLRPPCIWFSTDDRFPTGMALHIIDFSSMGSAAADNRGNQFVAYPETLCDSVPRQHFYYGYFSELTCIPVFNPLPAANSDNVDLDRSQAITEGTVECSPKPGVKPSPQEYRNLRKFDNKSVPTYGVNRRSDDLPVSDPDPDSEYAVKQSNTVPRSACDDNHLVVSNYNGHSAKELCENDMSLGPDFVSRKEGLFCDMCTRTVWPLCSTGVSVNCFDLTKSKLRVSQVVRRSDGTTGISTEEHKDYSDGMTVWE